MDSNSLCLEGFRPQFRETKKCYRIFHFQKIYKNKARMFEKRKRRNENLAFFMINFLMSRPRSHL